MKNPMIDFHTTKILEHLGFRETRDKPGLWYYKQTETDILYVDFRKEDGRRYASISGKMENDGDKFPLLVKVRELREQAKMTGKLPPEVAGAAQSVVKPSEQKPQAPAQSAAQTQKPTADTAQPAAQEEGIYITVNVGGIWEKHRYTQADYAAIEERTIKTNLDALEKVALSVQTGKRYFGLSDEQVILTIFDSVRQHTHFVFERWATAKVLDEYRQKNNRDKK